MLISLADIYARNLAPAVGIDEESATGTSNGASAPCSGAQVWFQVNVERWLSRRETL